MTSRTDSPNNNLLKRIFTNDELVMVIILLNASLFIALDINPDLVNEIGNWVSWIDFACVIFFIAEALIKISEHRFKAYINDNWNKLDFLIVIASVPVLVEPFMQNLGSEFGWVGVFRVARIFKLTRVLRSLRILQYTRNNPSEIFRKTKGAIYTLLIIAGSNLLIAWMDISPNWISEYYRYYPSAIIISITWIVSGLYSAIHEVHVNKEDNRSRIPQAVESIISALFQIFIWTIGLFFAFKKAGFNTSAILAGVGLGGMAVALAAQDFIGNLIGGILLYFKDSFKVGHNIKIGGYQGEVIKLGISDIRIKDTSGTVTSLPNKMFISEPIENFTEAELASDLICLTLDKKLSSKKLKIATELILNEAKSNQFIKDDYSVRFAPMSLNAHELRIEYYLDKDALINFEGNEKEPLQELINEQNTTFYIRIVEALESCEIYLG
jgi:small-conductance mechanosensitive channel